jgi:hypothetical protein
MSTIIKLKRDTAQNWYDNNPVLALGEPGFETDTKLLKYGDGIRTWRNLDYITVEFPTTIEHADVATYLEGGAANKIPYQTDADVTEFINSPNTNQIRYLQWTGTNFTWASINSNQLIGTTLPASIINSSLRSVGTLDNLNVTGFITGTINTPSQPQITSLGTLISLYVTGTISGDNITGTLNTAAQPNITSVGTLTGLSVAGDISGTLTTAYQPNITTVGTLIGLTVTNTIDGSINGSAGSVSAANITDTTLASNVVSSSLTSVGTLGNLTVTNPISGSVTGSAGSVDANNLTGTTLNSGVVNSSLTSVGTLNGLTSSGTVSFTNATQGTSYASGQALLVTGGVGVGGNIYTNGTLTINGSLTGVAANFSGAVTISGTDIRAFAIAMAAALA